MYEKKTEIMAPHAITLLWVRGRVYNACVRRVLGQVMQQRPIEARSRCLRRSSCPRRRTFLHGCFQRQCSCSGEHKQQSSANCWRNIAADVSALSVLLTGLLVEASPESSSATTISIAIYYLLPTTYYLLYTTYYGLDSN